MSNQSPDFRRHVKLKALRCRRTGKMSSIQEHLSCPYCSGDAEAIARTGRYSDFCEYETTDPINFGFIDGSSRNQHG
jgi:hypothetical protein